MRTALAVAFTVVGVAMCSEEGSNASAGCAGVGSDPYARQPHGCCPGLDKCLGSWTKGRRSYYKCYTRGACPPPSTPSPTPRRRRSSSPGHGTGPFKAMGCGAHQNPTSSWIWNRGSGTHPSCDKRLTGKNGYMCEGNDPTSLYVDLASAQGDKTGCYMWKSPCTFDLARVAKLTWQIDLINCENAWAAPLWISPHNWKFPIYKSGEIDLVELCPVGVVATNFAGTGGKGEYQKRWGHANSLNGAKMGTMEFQGANLVTSICNVDGHGCQSGSQYPNFRGQVNSDRGYYTIISDLWNGHGGQPGDDGWKGCRARNDRNSQCQYAVGKIKIYSNDGRPMYGGGKCAALNGNAQELVGEMNETVVVV